MARYRIVLRRPMGPTQPHRDRKWRELSTDQPSLAHALAWAYQQITRTSPDTVAQISSVQVLLAPDARATPKAGIP